ncbi:MAG: cbb3-type cytochrome oxidase maturation protein [Salibacteraceae bacterium]|jgi:cbb3-type cytochrome oxidase maturation protein
MSVIFILVGFSLLVALFFLGSFIWAVKDGQYEDDYTPSVRMLFDDADFKNESSDMSEQSSNTKLKK